LNSVFVDSSVWIDHLRGVPTPQTLALRGLLEALDPESGEDDPPAILMGDLVLLEVLRGIVDERAHVRTREVLLSFPQVRLGGTEAALGAAGHYRHLRRQGITVRKTVDCLIATWCITRNVPLLHSDRDFEPFVEHLGLMTLEGRESP